MSDESWIDLAIPFIERFEGLSLKAYPDPISGGEPYTIGYGSTGPSITKDTVWTQEQADDDLYNRLASEFGPGVENVITAPMTPNQEAAMVSLAYNIGVQAFSASTLVKKFNAGDVQRASDEFPKWNRAGGSVIQGLVTRRAAERSMFLGES